MAGDETKFNTLDFMRSFEFAKNSGLGTTTHAGEICGAKSVDEAIKLGVTRIGHGVRSLKAKKR